MGIKIGLKTALLLFLMALLAACGSSKLEVEKNSLRAENETLKGRVQQLTDENSKFKSELDSLKVELEDLKQTDQYLFSKAKEQLASSNDKDAKELLDKLLTRFPNSTYKAQATGLLKDINSKIAIADAVENGESEIKRAISGHEFDKAWTMLRSINKYISDDKYSELEKAINAEQNKPISLDLRDLLAEKDKYNGRRIKIGPLKVWLTYHSSESLGATGAGDSNTNIDYEKMQNKQALRRIERGQSINYVVGIFKKGYMWGDTYIEPRIEAEEISY